MLRPLQLEDAEAFMALRTKSIAANPECFCSSIGEVQQQGLNHYRELISAHEHATRQQLYGAFSDSGQLQGVIAIEQLAGALRAHRGRIWGLMVDPDCRRQGVARQLCQQALDTGKALALEKISLELTGEAVAALHLYRALGFRIESIEPLALKLDGRYLDEIRMSLCF